MELEKTLPESRLPDNQMTSCPSSPNFPLVPALPLERCITAEGELPSLSCFVPWQNTRKMQNSMKNTFPGLCTRALTPAIRAPLGSFQASPSSARPGQGMCCYLPFTFPPFFLLVCFPHDWETIASSTWSPSPIPGKIAGNGEHLHNRL